MLRCILTLALLSGACGLERRGDSRERLRNRDVACTDRAKPLAFRYALAQAAFRDGCYDVRVRGAEDPNHPDDQVLSELIYCCPH